MSVKYNLYILLGNINVLFFLIIICEYLYFDKPWVFHLIQPQRLVMYNSIFIKIEMIFIYKFIILKIKHK